MESLRLRKIWKISEALLKRARVALPEPAQNVETEFQGLAAEFDEMIDHNEHEIALDMLEQMGLTCSREGRLLEGSGTGAREHGLG